MLITTFLHQTHYHSSWHSTLEAGLKSMNANYLQTLLDDKNWLPGIHNIFNAFSLPMNEVNFVLLGESPYPRVESANGYAFWDQAVGPLWSNTGFSKAVNRATSLRNFMKMLLVADKKICIENMQQATIAKLDHSLFIQTNQQLFQRLLDHGFLLLNASLTLHIAQSVMNVKTSAQHWQPFLKTIFHAFSKKPPILLLFGNIAQHSAKKIEVMHFPNIVAPHPYNLSFISHPDVIKLFKPLELLKPTLGVS